MALTDPASQDEAHSQPEAGDFDPDAILIRGLIAIIDLAGANEAVRSQAEQTLLRVGVTAITPAEGTAFDPETCNAVSTAAADDPGHAWTVAGTIRPGWALGDRVIRPAEVTLWQ
jgi:hypothetical protein